MVLNYLLLYKYWFYMYDAREIKNRADDVLAVYNHPE